MAAMVPCFVLLSKGMGAFLHISNRQYGVDFVCSDLGIRIVFFGGRAGTRFY
jgi:hypothetical protein